MLLRNSKLDDQPEHPGKQPESTMNQSYGDVEKQSTTLDNIIINDNESVDKVKDEEICRAESIENEKITSTLPKEDLHVSPEDCIASNSGQGNEIITSSTEEHITNVNPHVITNDVTEDKKIDAVDTQNEVIESSSTIVPSNPKEESMHAVLQGITSEKAIDEVDMHKEVLENSSKIGSNYEIEEKSMIEVDDSETKTEELLEKESEKTFFPQPLAREAGDIESMVMQKARIEDGESRKAELCEIETNTENMIMMQEIEPKTEKPDEYSFNISSEDIKTSDSSHEIETISFEEQRATAHSPIIVDQKTEDQSLDAAETKEETPELQNVSTIDSNEKTEGNSTIQVGGHLEKGSEKPSSIQDFIGNDSGDELTVTDEVKPEDVNRVEQFERNIQCDLLKEEVHVEDQHTETTGLPENQSLTKNPQGMLGEKTEGTTGEPDTNENTKEQQNGVIKVSNEDDDKNSSTPLDASRMNNDTYLEKEIEKPPIIESSTRDTNGESTTVHEAEIGNEYMRKGGPYESDKDTDSTLLKRENLPQAPEDHKPSASSEDIETTCFLDEQRLTANPQSITSAKISDATDAEENVATKTPHEQVDCSQKEHDKHCEKESEISSREDELIKVELVEKERNTVITLDNEAAQVEKQTGSLQAAPDDITASDSAHETKTSSHKEESLTSDPQEITNDKTEETIADASDTETLVLQGNATNIVDSNNEKNSLIEEDGSQKPSLKEVSMVKADENVSTITQEKHEETLVKEEVPIESLQVADGDTEASTFVQDRGSSLEEQSLNKKSQGIMDDNEDKTNDATNSEKESQEDKNAATTTSYEDSEVNSQIQGDVSQLELSEHLEKESENTPLIEAHARDTAENTLAKEEAEMEKPTEYVQATTADINAPAYSQDTETNTIVAACTKEKTLEVVVAKVPNWDNEDNLPIEEDCSQKPSLNEASMGNANDDASTNMHEAKFVDENITKDDLFEDEKNKECTSIEKEVYSEPLQEADADIKACTSFQDRETTFLEERGLTMNPQKIDGDNEEKTSDVTNLKEETPENKDEATTIPHEDTEENSPSLVDSSQMEQKEHLEMKTEKASLTEKLTGDTIENTLKEEAHMEKPFEDFQIAIGDIRDSASGQDTELSSKEVQVPPADPRETSPDKTEEKTTDASCAHEDEPALKEAATGDSIDVQSPIMHEVKFEDDHLIKDDLIGNQKYTERILVNEKASIESSSVEVQGLITDSKEITDDHKEDGTIDATKLEQETFQDKNNATTAPYKDAEGISVIQTDCSQIECSEHLEKETENPSLPEAQTGDVTESALLKEEPEMEKFVDSIHVPTETSGHDTETSSLEERILTVDPQEISCDKSKERIGDVTDTNEETLEVQDMAINVPIGNIEDNSPTKVDGSQEPSEALMENVAHHESFLEADVVENEKNTDGTLIKEERSIESWQATTEDIKESASGQDREPSSQEEQSLVANSREIDDERDDKTIDATDLTEETSKEKASVAIQIPSPKDSDANTDTVVDLAEDPNQMQEESSIATTSEEHTMTSNAPVANAISTASEPSEQDIDKTDTEKMTVVDDRSPKIPTNENLIKADPTESMKAGAQVQDEENKAELKQRDTEALEEVLSSNVASETNLTSNPFLESGKETEPEAENEEAQKQDEDFRVAAPVPDSSIQKLEKDVESCPASAADSEISPDENATEYTDCKESEVVEDATKNFSNDKNLTEREQEETECKQEKVLSGETVKEIKEPASIPVANDLLPKSFIETSGIDHSTTERQLSTNKDLQTGKTPTGDDEDRRRDEDEKEEAGEQKISEFSSAALNIIEAGDKDGANTSIADLDDKAPDIIQRASSATESQEVENISVGETSPSLFHCEIDDSENAHIGTDEKPNSNEVGFAPEERKSGHEPKIQVLKCDTIPKAEEYLEAAAEIKSETGKVDISSEKITEEDEDVRNDRHGSCKEAITDSHLEDHAKQEQNTNTEEISEVVKISNETAKVSNDPEQAIDKANETEEKLQVNSSTMVDNEDKSKGADENIICEAPPTNTVHTTIEGIECKKENENTIMMQHQAEDIKSKQETSPLNEFTQGIESEKQAQQYETCSSNEVQMKDEVNLMHPERKGEEEAMKAEDRDNNTSDTTEVSSGGASHDVREDNENSTNKNKYSEERCPRENLEAKVPNEEQEEEAIPKVPMLATEERQLERTSEAVTKAKEVDSQEAKVIDDDSIQNSSSTASENILVTNIHQSSMEDTAQSNEKQECQRQIASPPISPINKCSATEVAEKDLPLQFAGLESTGGAELQVTPLHSEDKNIVPEADHTNSINPENTIGNDNVPLIEHESSTECPQGEHELLKNPALEREETASQETEKSAKKSESKDIDKPSPSDLFQVSTKEASQTAYQPADEKEPAPHIEHLRAEKTGEAELEDTKTDEDRDDEEESSEQIQSEMCADAPVMVDAGDADVKAAHKKSHNILSGVGSKVKHSIAKVKKAITGKASHPKPPSPK